MWNCMLFWFNGIDLKCRHTKNNNYQMKVYLCNKNPTKIFSFMLQNPMNTLKSYYFNNEVENTRIRITEYWKTSLAISFMTIILPMPRQKKQQQYLQQIKKHIKYAKNIVYTMLIILIVILVALRCILTWNHYNLK